MLKSFTLSFIGIFVAMDVIGVLPMYLAMTQRLSRSERSEMAKSSMMVAFIVALVFTLIGQAIFRFLGITLFDFRIAGGVVLLLVSLADLIGKQEAQNRASGSTGVVPIAVPLITGPGVLTTLILQVGTFGYITTVFGLLANYLLAWVMLRYSDYVTRVIGKDGTVVVSKIAALLLAALAVSMIRVGLYGAVSAFH